MKSNTIYLLLLLFGIMGFNLHLVIGINKFIFAGWCVLLSFSSWAKNDQTAFDTDLQIYMRVVCK
jgi:hypothetical protein